MSLLAVKRRAQGSTYEDETYTGLDLRSMLAFGSKFIKCTFQDSRLDMADMRNGRLEGCVFINCNLTKVDFGASFLEDVLFDGCDLEQASFMGCHLNTVSFKDCRMAYGETLFQNATVRQAVKFQKCNLHGSNLDFRQAEPGAMTFDDCNLWGVKMALGCAFWQSRFDEKTCQRFVAMVARVYPTEAGKSTLARLAGDEYATVERAMREQKR